LNIAGFSEVQKYRYVGEITTFRWQILSPTNSRNLKGGFVVISLQYLEKGEHKILGF
jgi:hypothetical protein